MQDGTQDAPKAQEAAGNDPGQVEQVKLAEERVPVPSNSVKVEPWSKHDPDGFLPPPDEWPEEDEKPPEKAKEPPKKEEPTPTTPEAAKEPEKASEEPGKEEELTEEDLAPPSNMNKEDRDRWQLLDAEDKKYILRVNKDWNKAGAKRLKELSEVHKALESESAREFVRFSAAHEEVGTFQYAIAQEFNRVYSGQKAKPDLLAAIRPVAQRYGIELNIPQAATPASDGTPKAQPTQDADKAEYEKANERISAIVALPSEELARLAWNDAEKFAQYQKDLATVARFNRAPSISPELEQRLQPALSFAQEQQQQQQFRNFWTEFVTELPEEFRNKETLDKVLEEVERNQAGYDRRFGVNNLKAQAHGAFEVVRRGELERKLAEQPKPTNTDAALKKARRAGLGGNPTGGQIPAAEVAHEDGIPRMPMSPFESSYCKTG